MEEETRREPDRERKLRLCGWKQEVAAVPEIGRGRPFESQTGHIHGSVHQQEEDGHNAGNGVELPGEKDQLVEESGGGGGVNTCTNNGGNDCPICFWSKCCK